MDQPDSSSGNEAEEHYHRHISQAMVSQREGAASVGVSGKAAEEYYRHE
eukprot:CAMPEP_0114270114 /NCGR_PEP_ID=MMETSP0058-20121206/27045_1 /TAXON_ID=36894 /ORGANISM="Pyramimonas parkeae, CCMP726" /LENGTH=48 /DNA_ID= /DNA_START= /DNA_END= /DNA_ORIENTATION=